MPTHKITIQDFADQGFVVEEVVASSSTKRIILQAHVLDDSVNYLVYPMPDNGKETKTFKKFREAIKAYNELP